MTPRPIEEIDNDEGNLEWLVEEEEDDCIIPLFQILGFTGKQNKLTVLIKDTL